MFDNLKEVPVWVIAFLVSGSIHEFAHAWVAYRLGDSTAERNGRLTFNPIAHIDPTGLILLVITSMMGFGFGWMKPVPVNHMNFRNPRQGMMLVSFAGPVSNIILIAFFILLFRILKIDVGQIIQGNNPLGYLLYIFLELNVILAVFNLLPIPPLDGSHIVEGLLPESWVEQYEKIYPYGFIILLGLIYFGVLNAIFGPVWNVVASLAFPA